MKLELQPYQKTLLYLISFFLVLILTPFFLDYFNIDIPAFINLIIVLLFFLLIYLIQIIIKHFPTILLKLMNIDLSTLFETTEDKTKLKKEFIMGLRLMRCVKKMNYRNLSQRTLIINLDNQVDERNILSEEFSSIKGLQKNRLKQYFSYKEPSKDKIQCEPKPSYNLLDHFKYFILNIFELYSNEEKSSISLQYLTDESRWIYLCHHLFIMYSFPMEKKIEGIYEENWMNLVKKICKVMTKKNDKIVLIIPENKLKETMSLLKDSIVYLVSEKRPVYLIITQIDGMKDFVDELSEKVHVHFNQQVIGSINYNWLDTNINNFPQKAIDEISDIIKDYLVLLATKENIEQKMHLIKTMRHLPKNVQFFCDNHFKIPIKIFHKRKNKEFNSSVHAIRGIYCY